MNSRSMFSSFAFSSTPLMIPPSQNHRSDNQLSPLTIQSSAERPNNHSKQNQPDDDDHFAVYGIKLWRWKISFQIPRRYTKVPTEDETSNPGQEEIRGNLKPNREFFRRLGARQTSESNWEFEAFNRTSNDNLISRSESTLCDDQHIYAEIDSADISFDPRTNPPLPPRCRTATPPSYPPYPSAAVANRGRSSRRKSMNIDKVKRSQSARR